MELEHLSVYGRRWNELVRTRLVSTGTAGYRDLILVTVVLNVRRKTYGDGHRAAGAEETRRRTGLRLGHPVRLGNWPAALPAVGGETRDTGWASPPNRKSDLLPRIRFERAVAVLPHSSFLPACRMSVFKTHRALAGAFGEHRSSAGPLWLRTVLNNEKPKEIPFGNELTHE